MSKECPKAVVDCTPGLSAINALGQAEISTYRIDDIRIDGINRQQRNAVAASFTHGERAPASPTVSALE